MKDDASPEQPSKRHHQPFMRGELFTFGRQKPRYNSIAHEIEAIEINRRAPCPLCGEPNGVERAYCQRCDYRLPWAAQLEGWPQFAPRENRLDRALNGHVLRDSDIRCRHCERRIDAYDRQCPHCGQWLIAAYRNSGLDPWQPDYDAWAAHRTALAPRSGCSGRLMMLCLFL